MIHGTDLMAKGGLTAFRRRKQLQKLIRPTRDILISRIPLLIKIPGDLVEDPPVHILHKGVDTEHLLNLPGRKQAQYPKAIDRLPAPNTLLSALPLPPKPT